MKKILNCNILKIFIGVVLMVIIMMIPFCVEEISENNMINKSHSMKKITFSLDSDAADVVMINRIHKALGTVYSEEVNVSLNNDIDNANTLFVADKGQSSKMFDEIKEMNKDDGFHGIFGEVSKYLDSTFLVSDIYGTTGEFLKISLTYDAGSLEGIYDVENNKFLEFKITSETVSDKDRKEILQTMMKYLNISIVGDWKYDGEAYVSSKAHLKILCENIDNSLKVYCTTDKDI